MFEYDVGQRWAYRTREQDRDSTLVIGRILRRFLKPSVIHVMLEGVVSPSTGDPLVIGHMPFSCEAMDASVLYHIESGVELDSRFEDGFAQWTRDKGSVFDQTVAQAIDAVLSVIGERADDPFDSIVARMRSQRSEELIGELYRQLFSLEQWFFLCQPENRRVPVEWVFPKGVNPTPALLAFTSRERAASAAIKLGIYQEGSDISIMPATVKGAVDWMSGPDFKNSWICFNLTYHDFALYCTDAAKLIQRK